VGHEGVIGVHDVGGGGDCAAVAIDDERYEELTRDLCERRTDGRVMDTGRDVRRILVEPLVRHIPTIAC
jgi:hypothetical protein